MPFGQMVVFYTRHHCAKVGQIGSILRIIVLWRREQRKRLNAVRGGVDTRGTREFVQCSVFCEPFTVF